MLVRSTFILKSLNAEAPASSIAAKIPLEIFDCTSPAAFSHHRVQSTQHAPCFSPVKANMHPEINRSASKKISAHMSLMQPFCF